MNDRRYKGILFMLLAALGFSIMGGAAKALSGSLNAGQLCFYRNAVGLVFLLFGFLVKPVNNPAGGQFPMLALRGIMGTVALYTLFFCILHLPLGTAMSYNLTSTIFISLFSIILFGEFLGFRISLALIIGFTGMLFIYKPVMDLAWYYHLAGLVSGITAAIAYLTVGRLTRYYDTRIIVLSFLLSGVLVPVISMLIHYTTGLEPDGLFIIDWEWPSGLEWLWIFLLGSSALFGQYFVTLAYGADKAGIVSVFSYTNIIFSVFIGMMLGDNFPDLLSWIGFICIMLSGIIITLVKKAEHIPNPAPDKKR